MNERTVTSIEQLKEYAKGQIVELPPFAEGQPFIARLKRPSIIGLAKHGKIPNHLLGKAGEIFVDSAGALDPDDNAMFKQLSELLEVMAEETFVEPAYTEMKEAGIELTDEQLMFVFNYSQQGVKALENFRTDAKN